MISLNKKRKDKGTGLAASSSVGTLKGNAPGKVNRGGGVKGTKSEYLILPPSLMKRQPAEIFALGSMSNIEDSDDETSDRDLPINYVSSLLIFMFKDILTINLNLSSLVSAHETTRIEGEMAGHSCSGESIELLRNFLQTKFRSNT